MQETDEIRLGRVVRHKMFGTEGYVTNISHHISGCNRYGVLARDGDWDSEEQFWYGDELEVTSDQFEPTHDPVTTTEISLGNVVQDEISDVEGYATSITFNLFNCPRVAVTPFVRDHAEETSAGSTSSETTNNDDGEIDDVSTEREWIDAPRLELVDDGIEDEWAELVENDVGSETGPAGDDLSRKNDLA